MSPIKLIAALLALTCAGCTTLPPFLTQSASAPYHQAISALCIQAGAAMARVLIQPGATALQMQSNIDSLAATAAPVCARPASPVITPAQYAALAQALAGAAVGNLKP